MNKDLSCSSCNRPCIRVGGKCIIAEIRKQSNLSFREAWEAVTSIELKSNPRIAYIPRNTFDQVDNILNKKHKLIKIGK